jgi:hypothetical protein
MNLMRRPPRRPLATPQPPPGLLGPQPAPDPQSPWPRGGTLIDATGTAGSSPSLGSYTFPCPCCQGYAPNVLYASLVSIPGTGCDCLDNYTVKLVRFPGATAGRRSGNGGTWTSGQAPPGACAAGLLSLALVCDAYEDVGWDFRLVLSCGAGTPAQTLAPVPDPARTFCTGPPSLPQAVLLNFPAVNLASVVGTPCCGGQVNIVVTN